MAISYFANGELSSGFHGWRVVVTIRGKRYQKYFSLRQPNSLVPEDLWYRYQYTRAQYYEARWMARSAAMQYLDFIQADHPTTRPYRGVGFRGITLGIGAGKSAASEFCYFSVNRRGDATKYYIDGQRTLTQAWEEAVRHWGRVYDIRPKDIEKKLVAVPSPDQFKSLRKQLNEKESCNLPPSVLHHVYAERRRDLEQAKAKKNTEDKLTNEDLLAMYSGLEREIAEYRK